MNTYDYFSYHLEDYVKKCHQHIIDHLWFGTSIPQPNPPGTHLSTRKAGLITSLTEKAVLPSLSRLSKLYFITIYQC